MSWTGEGDVVVPEGTPHEIQTVKNYRFQVSSPIGCTRLCVGETQGNTARPVTAKVIENEDLSDFFEKEGRVLHTLHNRPHPGFPKLMGTVQAENKGRCFIVMEELGMDLNAYVRAERGLPEDEVQVLFRQLLSSVAHCHKNQIVLRDIKLGKIFFSTTRRSQLVFADLDGAEVMTGGRVGQLRDQKGSPAYVCPEVLCCKPYGGYAADMWSLGVVLYRMLTGNYPFHDAEPARLFDKILLGSCAIHFPASVSTSAKNLIRRLLERNPASRPSAASLLQHDPWLQHSPDEAMATLRRRRSVSTRTSTAALFPSRFSSLPIADSDAGGSEAIASQGGGSVSGGVGRRRSSGSESGSVGVRVAGFSDSASAGRSPSLLNRRGSSSSLASDDGSERDVGDDESEQLVPDYDDNEDSKQPITPTRGKSFNLGSASAASAKASSAAAPKNRLTTVVVSAFDKEQLEVVAAAAVAAKKRTSVELVEDRCIRRRVSRKGFVRPPGLLGWEDAQALEISPSPSPSTVAEQRVATA